MTAEQKNWLDAKRAEGYRARHNTPGGHRWVKTGMLHPDGTFEPIYQARPSVRPGSFEVGVLEAIGPGAPQMQGP